MRSAGDGEVNRRLITLSFCLFLLTVVTCSVARADVTWNLNNIGFTDGATITGSFTTSSNITLTSYNIFLNLPNSTPIQAVKSAGSYLPNGIGFAFNSAFTEYVDLFFTTPMTVNTKTLSLSSGTLCPTPGGHCYGLSGFGSLDDPPPPSVPEPASIVMLTTVLGFVAIKLRHRQAR